MGVKTKVKKRWLIPGGLIVLAVALAGWWSFSGRHWALEIALERVKEKFSRSGILLKSEAVWWQNYKTVGISGFSLQQGDGLILAKADTILAEIGILKSLKGTPFFNEVYLHQATIRIARHTTPIDTLTAPTFADTAKAETIRSLPGEKLNRIYNLLARAENFLPEAIFADSIHLQYQSRTGNTINVGATNARLKQGEFSAQIITNTNSPLQSLWKLAGSLQKENGRRITLQCLPSEKNSALKLPGDTDTAWLAWDSLGAEILLPNRKDSETLAVQGKAMVKNMRVYHYRLAQQPIRLEEAGGEIALRWAPGEVATQEGSAFVINGVSWPFYMQLEDKEEGLFVAVGIPEKRLPAEKFFGHLPVSLFESLEGMQTTGEVSFQFATSVVLHSPETFKLEADMEGYNLRIKQFGETNLRKINGSFLYEPEVNGRKVRSILVSDDSERYVKLNDISPFLIASVLTAEDGSFWNHRGFNEDAFRESVVQNLKDSAFTRGGSTITMQLVKNVFLSHRKTVTRKLEEMLIVWLIENLRLSSKERMLEIYLNIIEWGPGIYGIREAASFYFEKTPAELTLAESIYLTSIIPKPRKWLYSFSKEGTLRPHHEGYYNLLTNIMLHRGQITAEDTVGLIPEVNLQGEARRIILSRIAPSDSLPPLLEEIERIELESETDEQLF